MKKYSIYVRLVNPLVKIKIGEISYHCSIDVLNTLAIDYANTYLCLVKSVELTYRKSIISSLDY